MNYTINRALLLIQVDAAHQTVIPIASIVTLRAKTTLHDASLTIETVVMQSHTIFHGSTEQVVALADELTIAMSDHHHVQAQTSDAITVATSERTSRLVENRFAQLMRQHSQLEITVDGIVHRVAALEQHIRQDVEMLTSRLGILDERFIATVAELRADDIDKHAALDTLRNLVRRIVEANGQ